jgi:hypothetical protein
MAQITNYTTLVNAIVAVTEDDGVEFALYIPTAISLAEDMLIKELDLPELEQKTTGSLTGGIRTLPKPTGYRFANYVRITVNNVMKQLVKKREDWLIDYWPNAVTTGEPKYYSDESLTNFVVAPTPNNTYAYEIKYTAAPTKLSGTNLTNYFVDKCPDLLFNAAMIELARFMKAWSQVQMWEAKYAQLRDSWNVEAMRKRRDDGQTPQNPDADVNSLKHTVQSGS